MTPIMEVPFVNFGRPRAAFLFDLLGTALSRKVGPM
jgi:hypothetical protein